MKESLELLESNEKLHKEIIKLKKESEKAKRDYNSEKRANKSLILANTRLVDENRFLKRDVARIKDVLEYIDYCKKTRNICSINKIKDILLGIKKEDLDDTL